MNPIPKAPAGLSPSSRRLWRTVLAELDQACRVPLDLVVLARALEALDRATTLDATLASFDSPVVIDHRGTPRRRPEALLAQRAHDTFMAAWRQLLQAWHTERRVRSFEGRPSPEDQAAHDRLLALVRTPVLIPPDDQEGEDDTDAIP
jgi:hypothetical protein